MVDSEVEHFDGHHRSLEESLLTGGFPRILDRGLDPTEWLASSLLASARKVSDILTCADHSSRALTVYGGTQTQRRGDGSLIP